MNTRAIFIALINLRHELKRNRKVKKKKKKKNDLLPIFFFSHSNKTLLLLSSAITFDKMYTRVCVCVVLSSLLWRITLNGNSENEIMVAHSSQNLTHFLCTRLNVICSVHHHQNRTFFSCTPIYECVVRKKNWSNENKLFHIISFFCVLHCIKCMNEVHTFQAAQSSQLLHIARIRVWNCFSIHCNTNKQNMHTNTYLLDQRTILKSLLSFELALIEWKIVNIVIAGISAAVAVVADTAVK